MHKHMKAPWNAQTHESTLEETMQNIQAQTGVPGPTVSASPGNLLEMQILGSHSRICIRNSRSGAQQSVSISPPGDSDVAFCWRNAALKKPQRDKMLQS